MADDVKLPFDEREAMRGQPVPEGITLTDAKLYIILRYLHKEYAAYHMSKLNAHQEKVRLIAQWQREKSADEKIKHMAETYVRVGRLCSEYAKARTIEAADALYDALNGFKEERKGKTNE